jgi:hypothetical protein
MTARLAADPDAGAGGATSGLSMNVTVLVSPLLWVLRLVIQ